MPGPVAVSAWPCGRVYNMKSNRYGSVKLPDSQILVVVGRVQEVVHFLIVDLHIADLNTKGRVSVCLSFNCSVHLLTRLKTGVFMLVKWFYSGGEFTGAQNLKQNKWF